MISVPPHPNPPRRRRPGVRFKLVPECSSTNLQTTVLFRVNFGHRSEVSGDLLFSFLQKMSQMACSSKASEKEKGDGWLRIGWVVLEKGSGGEGRDNPRL